MPGYQPALAQLVLRRGSRGDLVVWAQEHLLSAGESGLAVTGIFSESTDAAVRAFQSAHGLAADGVIGTSTWNALLAFSPAPMHWSAWAARASARAARISRVTQPSRPRSASLPAKAYEILPHARP